MRERFEAIARGWRHLARRATERERNSPRDRDAGSEEGRGITEEERSRCGGKETEQDGRSSACALRHKLLDHQPARIRNPTFSLLASGLQLASQNTFTLRPWAHVTTLEHRSFEFLFRQRGRKVQGSALRFALKRFGSRREQATCFSLYFVATPIRSTTIAPPLSLSLSLLVSSSSFLFLRCHEFE